MAKTIQDLFYLITFGFIEIKIFFFQLHLKPIYLNSFYQHIFKNQIQISPTALLHRYERRRITINWLLFSISFIYRALNETGKIYPANYHYEDDPDHEIKFQKYCATED